MLKTFLVEKNFWSKKIFGKKKLWSKKIMVKKIFCQKKIWVEKNFWSKNIFCWKFFGHVWTCLDKSEHTGLDKFEQVWTSLNMFGQVWTCLEIAEIFFNLIGWVWKKKILHFCQKFLQFFWKFLQNFWFFFRFCQTDSKTCLWKSGQVWTRIIGSNGSEMWEIYLILN